MNVPNHRDDKDPRPKERARKQPREEGCAWCWQDKAARRLIRQQLQKREAAACLAIYDALTEAASDQNSVAHVLRTSQSYLGDLAGLSLATTKRFLPVLRELGVVAYDDVPKGLKKAHDYLLLSIAHSEPSIAQEIASNRATIEEGKKMKNQTNGSVITEPSQQSDDMSISKKPLLERVATIGGADAAQLTKSAWAAAQKALNEIRAVCPNVTVDEIDRRAGNYRAHFDGAAITPHALAKWWAKCEGPPAGKSAVMEPKFRTAW